MIFTHQSTLSDNAQEGPSSLLGNSHVVTVVDVENVPLSFIGVQNNVEAEEIQDTMHPAIQNVSTGEAAGKKNKNGGPPGSLSQLVFEFDNIVVGYLDFNSREAVQQQREFDDPAKFGKVKTDVVNRVLDLLLERGDSTTVPSTKFFDNIVEILGQKYPAVFVEDPTTIVNGQKVQLFSERGTGGVNSIKGRIPLSILN